MQISRRFCIAPMIDWSDRHARYFWRLLTENSLLYTEMITTGALIHGDVDHHLHFHPAEHPVALQLGGSSPADLAHCAKLGEQYGYDEINLNIGCPSDRVQSGKFGACLMAEPELVRDCLAEMISAVNIPITAKCRIGIDDQDEYQDLENFINIAKQSGCETFIVHARKAWLKGLSPKQNREIPPLNYERVYQLKKDHPELEIILNGGLQNFEQCDEALKHVDGVMMGREAYKNPLILAQVDQHFFNETRETLSPLSLLNELSTYVEQELEKGTYLSHITRHLLGLFQGMPGARKFRRHLTEYAVKKGANIKVLKDAWDMIDFEGLPQFPLPQ